MLLFVWLWLFLPVILVFLISLDWSLPMKRSIYMDRFLILSLPAFLILISHGIARVFERKWVLGAVMSAALLVPVAASVYAQFSDQTYHRDDWRQAIADIKAEAQSGDLVLVRPHDYVPLHYYSLQELPWLTVPYLESADEYENYLETHLAQDVSVGERVWTMVVCENADPHRFAQGIQQQLVRKVEEDEVRLWLLQNFGLVEDRVYRGVYLSLYERR